MIRSTRAYSRASRDCSRHRRPMRRLASLSSVLVVLAGCAGSVVIPEPRPVVNRQGARIQLEAAESRVIYDWVDAQVEEIGLNPSFWIISNPATSDLLPWETLDISENADSASFQYSRQAPDVVQVYQIYAHLHLTERRGEIGEWLPGADALDGWDLELAIVERMAEAWLLGRASYSFAPYSPVDELMYAAREGMLEPLLLSLRGFEFPEVRDAWLAANPDGEAEFREWYARRIGGEPAPIAGGF
ncbi:MAG: hypothetical protein RQ745_05770 [Longimicrobiales bacterium]|nr:hypothetical protein [Longimicrobiales bacterium]